MSPELAEAPAVPAPDAPGRYRLRQVFRYDYDAPIRELLHRLVVVPPRRHGDQRLLFGAVTVQEPGGVSSGGPALRAGVSWHEDSGGNRICVVRAPQVRSALEMVVDVVVERDGTPHHVPEDAPRDRHWSASTRLTRADARIRALAATRRCADPLETADALCALVHERVRYGFDATDVSTPAAQALLGGVGVCQDQAHVMLALGRSAGLACRYVSGHLVGQGGTHAWVEVLVPAGTGARVVAFDPCHGRRCDARYVTVAVGRDYADVPPTSGWYAGTARGTLTTRRSLLCDAVPA